MDKSFEAFADYSDGETAMITRVGLRLESGALLLEEESGRQMRWSLETLRAVEDQADQGGLLLYPADESLKRLNLRYAKFAKKLRKAAPNLKKRPPVSNKGAIARWAAGAITSVMVIVFVLVPILANQLAEFIPPEGERALGDATFEQVRKALGNDFFEVNICDDVDGSQALTVMETRLDPGDDLPFPIQVTVLDHDLVNAFALPGGRIVLFRGLLEKASGADEVAAVLAHEIGHVVNRDPTRDALRSAGSIGVLGLLLGDFAGGTAVLFLTNQLINAKYSQSAETGADDYAHDLLARGGYDPAALGSFFQRLKDTHGDTEGFLSHLSSHPQMQARIEAAQAAADRAGNSFTPILSKDEWEALRGICGAVPPAKDDADHDGQDTGLSGAN
ncbi:MAG: M48 family metallopeptidase [Maritimibacter sp.]